VLDFIQAQAGKKVTLDYFEAKNELKKIEKNKKVIKFEP